MHKRKFQFGSSSIEYALPAGLILMVLISAIATLPGILQDWFANTMNGNMASDKMSVAALGKPVLSPQMRNNLSMLPPLQAGEEQVCTKNYCVNLPVIKSNAMIETAGGNGNELVSKLSLALEQLIEQLKEEEADASLIALIEKLANEGHGLADVMSMLKEQKEVEAQQLAEEQAKLNELNQLDAQSTSTSDSARMTQIASASLESRAINWTTNTPSIYDPSVGKFVPIKNILNSDPAGFYEANLIQQINSFNTPNEFQLLIGIKPANIKNYTELAQYLEAQAKKSYYPMNLNNTMLRNQEWITKLTGKSPEQRYNEYMAQTVQPILDFIDAKGDGTIDQALVARIAEARRQYEAEQAQRLAAAREAERVRTSLDSSSFSDARNQLNAFLSSRPALANEFSDVKALIDASADNIETISDGVSSNQNITLNQVETSVDTTHQDSNGICTTAYQSYRCYRRPYQGQWGMGY